MGVEKTISIIPHYFNIGKISIQIKMEIYKFLKVVINPKQKAGKNYKITKVKEITFVVVGKII